MQSIDICELRSRLGEISQAELGKRLGVSQATVSRLEKGKQAVEGPVAIILAQLDQRAKATSKKTERRKPSRMEART